MYIYDQFGGKIDLKDVGYVEQLVRLKNTSGSNPWPVIEKCIEVWSLKNPTEYKSFLVEVDQTRYTRRNKFGASKTMGTRYLLDIPTQVMQMIRAIYSVEELPMNKNFLQEFAKKFPKFSVAEKI